MKLQTQIPLKKADNQIDYSSQLLLLGSCFSENIGDKLSYFKFRLLQNPFGILFNPKAIENLVERAVQQKIYSEADVFFHNELWHCYDTHSDLSATSKEDLLTTLNLALEATRNQIETSTHILITLGTVWVYRYKKTNKIVANCHKVSQANFTKELLSVDEITQSLKNSIQQVRSLNKEAQLLFTVSPVRHLKDGFVENQLGKAHLCAAIQETIGVPPLGVRGLYFPSYELMMDELRDYRFYKTDMIHPNELAIDYIWEKFKNVWISEMAYPTMDKVNEIQKGLKHRPFHPESEQHQKFLKSLQEKIAYIKKDYPFMEFN